MNEQQAPGPQRQHLVFTALHVRHLKNFLAELHDLFQHVHKVASILTHRHMYKGDAGYAPVQWSKAISPLFCQHLSKDEAVFAIYDKQKDRREFLTLSCSPAKETEKR